jgi:PhoPQ-activated pathogenicity-related protein
MFRIPTPTLDTAIGATAEVYAEINKAAGKVPLPNRLTVAMRRRALAAIGISFFAFTAATLAAEAPTADQNAVATASKSVPAGYHTIPAHPIEPLAINAKASAAFVDQLYKELMEWNPPWSPSATNDASLRGHC